MKFKDKLALVPHKPGSYQMKDKNGNIIYVGKAKDLNKRLSSYFNRIHTGKTAKMVSLIEDFQYIVASSELEAFIIEINLIKEFNPKYNIMLTDDKRYPYIAVSNEKNPKIYYTRDLGKKAKYFGPYPNAKAAKEVCDMLNKMYPLRKCNKIPKKECLYYHIGQCLAPCIRKVEDSEYKDIVNKLNLFLKGNVKDEIKRLTKLMNEASEKLEFEIAMEYLNLIENLKAIREPFECSISVPLHGSELKNVDLEILKKELKSFGLLLKQTVSFSSPLKLTLFIEIGFVMAIFLLLFTFVF